MGRRSSHLQAEQKPARCPNPSLSVRGREMALTSIHNPPCTPPSLHPSPSISVIGLWHGIFIREGGLKCEMLIQLLFGCFCWIWDYSYQIFRTSSWLTPMIIRAERDSLTDMDLQISKHLCLNFSPGKKVYIFMIQEGLCVMLWLSSYLGFYLWCIYTVVGTGTVQHFVQYKYLCQCCSPASVL